MTMIKNLFSYWRKKLPKVTEMPSTEELCIKQTQDMLNQYAESSNYLSWSKHTLQELRTIRLRKLLRYAKTHSPWYQKSLAHINVDEFTEEHLDEIPSLDKVTLMENWDEIVTDRRLSLALVEQHIEKMNDDGDTLYLLDNYHALATSGSSGKRGIYVYNWEEWISFYLFNIRYASRNSRIPSITLNSNQKWKSAMIVISNTVYAMYSLARTFKFNEIEDFYIPITLPIHQIIAELNQIKPDFLIGTPTTLSRICHEPHIRKLSIQPKMITLAGEPLYKPIRELIQNTWPKAYINNVYGSSEGLFAVSCGTNSYEMHLNDDGCIVQPVDMQNNPVSEGTIPSKIYLTNLYLYTLPLIRYEFSDQLQFLDKTCACGVNHQLIAEPEGRPEFDFTYHGDVFVHHLTFVTPLLLEKNIHEYQVIQTEKGVNIKIISGGYIDKNRLRTTLCNSLEVLGLHDPEVTFSEVTQFEYTQSSKLRRFIKLTIS